MSLERGVDDAGVSTLLVVAAGLTVGVLVLFEEWAGVAGAVLAFAAAALVLWYGDDDREDRRPT